MKQKVQIIHFIFVSTIILSAKFLITRGVDSLFLIYSCKNLNENPWQYNIFGNKFLNFSVIFGFLMFFIALYVPPIQTVLRVVPFGLREWLIVFLVGLVNVVLIELAKIFINKNLKERVVV